MLQGAADLIAGDDQMAVATSELAALKLPGCREVAVYLDRESPCWTGPAGGWWWWRDGEVMSACVRLPLTDAGLRVTVC